MYVREKSNFKVLKKLNKNILQKLSNRTVTKLYRNLTFFLTISPSAASSQTLDKLHKQLISLRFDPKSKPVVCVFSILIQGTKTEKKELMKVLVNFE